MFRQFFILVLTVIIAFLSLLCLFPVCPLFLLLRSIVAALASWRRKDLHKLVPGPKVVFAYDSIAHKPKLNLAGFFILENKPELENIRELAQRRIIDKLQVQCQSHCQSQNQSQGQGHNIDENNNNCETAEPLIGEKEKLMYPELQQTWTTFLGYFFWKWDKQFNISNHIRMYDYGKDLPLPMDSECNEDDLQGVFGGLLEKPWVKGRSPWEILFIGPFRSKHHFRSGKEKEESAHSQEYAIAFRIHHAIGDGYSFLKVLQDAAGVSMTNRRINFPTYSMWEKALGLVVLPFKFPYDVAGNLVDSFDGRNSWHLVKTKLCRQYNSSISKPFSMNLIKEIKNKHGVSYNAVLCAAAGGAYCRLMKDAGQKVPGNVSCFFPFPLPNHPGGLVLHAASIFIRWPMAQASCSIERLHKINEQLRKPKFYTGHLFYNAVSLFLGTAPTILTRMSRNKICSTLGVSCIPGPDEPLDFLGAKMKDVIVGAGAAAGKLAGTMVLLSICGKQRFVANIDKTVFPSEKLFAKLGDYVEEELTNMLLAEDLDWSASLQVV